MPVSRLFASLEVLLGCRFVTKWRHLVRIDAYHQIVNVIVDLREPVAGSGRNHHDVAHLQVVALAVADRRSVVTRPIEEPYRLLRRRPAHHVRDVRPCLLYTSPSPR